MEWQFGFGPFEALAAINIAAGVIYVFLLSFSTERREEKPRPLRRVKR